MTTFALLAEVQRDAANGFVGLNASGQMGAAHLPDVYLPAALAASLYAPKSAWVDFIAASRMEAADGTPAKTEADNLTGWRLADTGTNESVSCLVRIPDFVEQVTIDVILRPQTTSSAKTTRLSFFATEIVPDATVPSEVKSYEATSAVPATALVIAAPLRVATELAVTPGSMCLLRVTRNTNSAGDTYTGGLDVIAIVVSHPYIGPGSPIVASSYTELT